MSVVTVYMEGGGDDEERQAALRTGMESFLARGLSGGEARPRVIPCGGRSTAYYRFSQRIAENREREVVILLVDSEQRVTAATVREHLQERPEDTWAKNLDPATDDQIHLMIQTMETWVVADTRALALYYGEGFDESELPETGDLESVSKASIDRALRAATGNSARKRYHKIWHARDLLRNMDPDTVQSRCPACRRLFETLAEEIGR